MLHSGHKTSVNGTQQAHNGRRFFSAGAGTYLDDVLERADVIAFRLNHLVHDQQKGSVVAEKKSGRLVE